MEDISYVNFFKFILSQKMRIPVIETGIIQNENIESLLTVDEQGYMRKKNMKPLPILSYLQKLCEENDLRNKLQQNPNDKICYFFKKGKRVLYDLTKTKDLLSKAKFSLVFELIQKYFPMINDNEKIVTVKLLYLNNEYHTEFYSGKNKLVDPVSLSILIDNFTIIMTHLEQSESKRVVQMQIEYIKDRENCFWLLNMPKCKLIEAKYTISHQLTCEFDIEQLEKAVSKYSKKETPSLKKIQKSNKYYEIKPKAKEEKVPEYVFKRGQLRNNNSNLDSPIRISSPNFIVDEEKENETKTKHSENTKVTEFSRNMASPQPPINEADKKPAFMDYLKGYIAFKIANPSESPSDFSAAVRSPTEQRKTLYKRMTNHRGSFKILPKLSKAHKKTPYDNEFVEMIMKTYFKHAQLDPQISADEFGMTSNLSCEDFTQLINNLESPKEDTNKIRITMPKLEESYFSRASSSLSNFPKKKFEIQFVKNILDKNKFFLDKISKPKAKTTNNKIINLLINSPRSRLKPLEIKKNPIVG